MADRGFINLIKMYNQIPNKAFQQGANGPVRYRENIIIPIRANVYENKLEERSSVERNHVVGLYVTPAGIKLRNGVTIAASGIFNSCFLQIRQGTDTILDRIYLSQILAANAQGLPFEVSLKGPINLSDSKLVVQDAPNVQSNTAIEIQVEYVKK